MVHRLVAGLLGLTLLAGAASARELRERIDEAIDRGSLWLARKQKPDGSWPGRETSYPMGPSALALLTLRTCGFPAKSVVIEKGFKELRRRYRSQRESETLKTYSIALTMMALEEHHAPPRASRKRSGGAEAERRTKLPPRELMWMREMTAWLLETQHKVGRGAYQGGIWRYPRGVYDNSNTQYALLGLKAARRSGVPVGAQVFLASAKHFMQVQESAGPVLQKVDRVPGADGTTYVEKRHVRARGWCYLVGDPSTGSMTAGAVGSLAICRSELMGRSAWSRKTAEACERSIQDGLAWLGHHFSVKSNPGRVGQHYYYLYALERAGILCGVEKMGDHDWYVEGARHLVAAQRGDGSWELKRRPGPDGKPSPVNAVRTCFALLFLKRGTVPVTLPAVTPR